MGGSVFSICDGSSCPSASVTAPRGEFVVLDTVVSCELLTVRHGERSIQVLGTEFSDAVDRNLRT